MTRKNFSLQKENDCKVQLRFVKCCTLVVTEGYHILLSTLNRLVTSFYYVQNVYQELAGNIISGKGSVASIDRGGGSEPLRRRFRGWSPLRKLLGYKKNLDWLNDIGKTLFYSIQYKNLLKYELSCS